MSDEMRLVSIGWPLEDALTFCFSARKEGSLEDFIQEQEKIYREKMMEVR